MSPMVRLPLTMEYALLGYFRHKAMYGYEIFQRLQQRTGLGLIWYLKQSQLYALLDKLEEAGYLQSRVELQDTRPSRKVYLLTPDGEQTYLHWLETPVKRVRSVRQEFMAKLILAGQESASTAQKLIHAQKEVCQDWLDMAQEEEISAHDTGQSEDRLIFLYRSRQIQAVMEWLIECEQLFPLSQPKTDGTEQETSLSVNGDSFGR